MLNATRSLLLLLTLATSIVAAERPSDPVTAAQVDAELAADKAAQAARGADPNGPVPASAREAVIAAMAPGLQQLERFAAADSGLSAEQRARARALHRDLRTRILAGKGLLTAAEQRDLVQDLAEARFGMERGEQQVTQLGNSVSERDATAKAHADVLAEAKRAHDATREELERERKLTAALKADNNALSLTLEKVRQAHAEAVRAAEAAKPKP